MSSFFDLVPDRVMSIETYLTSINDENQRELTFKLLDISSSVLEAIANQYRSNRQLPQIRITKDQNIPAEGMDGMIYVSSSLIEHCLSFNFPSFRNIEASSKPFVHLDSATMAAAMFGWVIAHEFFHIVRCHNEIANGGTEMVTSRALEHDADLCAAAALFRQFQFRYRSILSDQDIRRLTFYSIFWPLRSLSVDQPQITHSSIATRLWQILVKLAIVPELDNGNERVDTSLSGERSQSSLAALRLTLVACERYYLATVPEASSILVELNSLREIGTLDEVVHEWMTIRERIATKSSSRT